MSADRKTEWTIDFDLLIQAGRFDDKGVPLNFLPVLPHIDEQFVWQGRLYRCYGICVDYDTLTYTIRGGNP